MKSLVGSLRVLSSDLYFSYCTLTTLTMLHLILFADDTNVFMSHKDPNYLSAMLNSEMDKLSIWFKANKLSLNLKKTKFMVCKPRQKRSICNIQISIDNQIIVKVKVRSPRYFFFSLFSFIFCNYCVANKINIQQQGGFICNIRV